MRQQSARLTSYSTPYFAYRQAIAAVTTASG